MRQSISGQMLKFVGEVFKGFWQAHDKAQSEVEFEHMTPNSKESLSIVIERNKYGNVGSPRGDPLRDSASGEYRSSELNRYNSGDTMECLKRRMKAKEYRPDSGDDEYIEEKKMLAKAGIELVSVTSETLNRIDDVLPFADYGITPESRNDNERWYNSSQPHRDSQDHYYLRICRLIASDAKEYYRAMSKIEEAFGESVMYEYGKLMVEETETYDLLIEKMAQWIRELMKPMLSDRACYDYRYLYYGICRQLGSRVIDTARLVKMRKDMLQQFTEQDVLDGEERPGSFGALHMDRTATVMERVWAEFVTKPEIIMDNLCFRESVTNTQVKKFCHAVRDIKQLQMKADLEDVDTSIRHAAALTDMVNKATHDRKIKVGLEAGPSNARIDTEIDRAAGPARVAENMLERQVLRYTMTEQQNQRARESIIDYGAVAYVKDVIYVHNSATSEAEKYRVIITRDDNLTVLTQENHVIMNETDIRIMLQDVSYAKFHYTNGQLYEREYRDVSGNIFTSGNESVSGRPHEVKYLNRVNDYDKLNVQSIRDRRRSKAVNATARPISKLTEEIRRHTVVSSRYADENKLVRGVIGPRERKIETDLVSRRSAHCNAELLFGDGTGGHMTCSTVTPTMSALSVLACMTARFESTPTKTLYWTMTNKTRMGDRALHLAHTMPCPNRHIRKSNDNVSVIRVFTNNERMWETSITLA